jgi:hypothetical protein
MTRGVTISSREHLARFRLAKTTRVFKLGEWKIHSFWSICPF